MKWDIFITLKYFFFLFLMNVIDAVIDLHPTTCRTDTAVKKQTKENYTHAHKQATLTAYNAPAIVFFFFFFFFFFKMVSSNPHFI